MHVYRYKSLGIDLQYLQNLMFLHQSAAAVVAAVNPTGPASGDPDVQLLVKVLSEAAKEVTSGLVTSPAKSKPGEFSMAAVPSLLTPDMGEAGCQGLQVKVYHGIARVVFYWSFASAPSCTSVLGNYRFRALTMYCQD